MTDFVDLVGRQRICRCLLLSEADVFLPAVCTGNPKPDISCTPGQREPPVRFTNTENYLVSEASVYGLLKALDLIASPAFI